MNVRDLAKNACAAFAAQGTSLLASVFTSLLVPKVLGVEGFGYWQLFVFYCSYSGLFLFGLNDGCYLLNGGKTRREIDKREINSQFLVGLVILIFSSACICSVALLLTQKADRAFVLCSFAAYTVLSGMATFLGYVFQAMNETKLFSLSTIIDRCTFAAPLILLVVMRGTDFRLYVLLYLIARMTSLLFCCWNARDILRAGIYSASVSIRICAESVRVGCKLLLANVADMLILGIGRFLVDASWGIEAFGEVSLSISLVNFFIMFVTQASMVLFPALRQGDVREQRAFYEVLRNASELLFPIAYLLYFPAVAFLELWLPQYSDSLTYFAFLVPVCVFNTKNDLCCITYFKVLRMEGRLLGVNLVSLAFSALLAQLSISLFGSLELVLLGAVASMIGRSLWSERTLNRSLGVAGNSLPYAEVALTLAFTLCTSLFDLWVGFALIVVCYALYLLVYKSTLLSLRNRAADLISQ